MTAKLDRTRTAKWVEAQMEAAPPLTQEQAYRLRQVLRSVIQDPDERSDRIEPAAETFGKSA